MSAYRYELPGCGPARAATTRTTCSATSGCRSARAPRSVPEDWLALFPSGGALDFESFGLTGFGEPVSYGDSGGIPDGARVGDVVTVAGEDRSLLLTAQGPTVLDPFALALYRHTTTPTGSLSPDVRAGDSPVETTQDEPPTRTADRRRRTTTPTGPTTCSTRCWTSSAPSSRPPPGEAPTVRLATHPGATGVLAGRRRRPGAAARSTPDGGPTCSPATGATPRDGSPVRDRRQGPQLPARRRGRPRPGWATATTRWPSRPTAGSSCSAPASTSPSTTPCAGPGRARTSRATERLTPAAVRGGRAGRAGPGSDSRPRRHATTRSTSAPASAPTTCA